MLQKTGKLDDQETLSLVKRKDLSLLENNSTIDSLIIIEIASLRVKSFIAQTRRDLVLLEKKWQI